MMLGRRRRFWALFAFRAEVEEWDLNWCLHSAGLGIGTGSNHVVERQRWTVVCGDFLSYSVVVMR